MKPIKKDIIDYYEEGYDIEVVEAIDEIQREELEKKEVKKRGVKRNE